MKKRGLTDILLALLFLFHANMVVAQEFVFGQVDIAVGDLPLTVEYADTFDLRAQGLQFRQELCADCGMLFKFERTRIVSMWMKNTLIPLDVAFIDSNGFIVNIEAMQPLDLTSVPSKGPVRYALEMNQGWFAKHGFKAGQKVLALP